jgi:hypothetical protein
LTLTGCINNNYGELYSRAEQQLARVVVSFDSMPFLLKPGDAILERHRVRQESKEVNGMVVETYLTSDTPQAMTGNTASQHIKQSLGKEKKKEQYWKWHCLVWSYKFDGSFYKKNEIIEIKMKAENVSEETALCELNANSHAVRERYNESSP